MGLIEPYDFVIDGTDNFAAKFLINDACVLAGKPFSHGAIGHFYGQLMTYIPGKGPCYRCVIRQPPPPGSVPSCREAGVIGAVAGIVGCMQALEAVKYIVGVGKPLTGRLLFVDTLEMEMQPLTLAEDPDCPVCGKHPTILAPFDEDAEACDLRG
jgi:molybdopterin/thiamine biosynthesis adenylyltransferase